MQLRKIILKRLEWLGHLFFYTVLRLGGQGAGYFFLYPVVFCYVICSPKIHRITQPYFSRRFPQHGWWRRRLHVYRNVLAFGRTLVDRAWIGLSRSRVISGRFEDGDRFQEIIARGRGVVVLLAHVGNWQSSFADLERLPVAIHALMEYDTRAVAKHFFDLGKKRSFTIIDVNGFMGGMVEATVALQRGEVVLIMGDRLAGGPSAVVSFLGSPLRLPLAPYRLAASTGAPLVVLFSAKTGRRHYRLFIADVLRCSGCERPSREQLVCHASRFAGALEHYVREYPYQWYNFFNIWQQ